MRFLLDTNICIFLIKCKPAIVLQRLKRSLVSGIGISSITLSELEYGVQKSAQVERNAVSLLRFLTPFEIVAFDDSAAREYGKIRAMLERNGQPIGNMDMLIGAHAKSLGLTLVTNNVREFKRIDGLRIEDWTKDSG
jgi:tRNA(fMet)-specific endonuclease VapC